MKSSNHLIKFWYHPRWYLDTWMKEHFISLQTKTTDQNQKQQKQAKRFVLMC